jgi:hypothetical protein
MMRNLPEHWRCDRRPRGWLPLLVRWWWGVALNARHATDAPAWALRRLSWLPLTRLAACVEWRRRVQFVHDENLAGIAEIRTAFGCGPQCRNDACADGTCRADQLYEMTAKVEVKK